MRIFCFLKHQQIQPSALTNALLANYEKPADLLGKNGFLKQLTKRGVERALQTEMTHHIGHEKHGKVANASSNTRNGTSKKAERASPSVVQ